MKTKKEKILRIFKENRLLLAVLLIATILRFWKLGSIPPHLTPDEAALGYNAYSILKTGKDEYGKFLPLIFKSFGDYKPGFYIYTAVPFVFTFGLNEYASRLPSALSGVLAVLLIYLIIKEAFSEKKPILEEVESNNKLALIAAFLLAVNPWHIFFSRGAWEVNLSLTLTLAGIYFFLRSFKKISLLPISALFFSLTLLTYQGAKLSTTIVVLLLVLFYWKEIKDKLFFYKKIVFGTIFLGVIIISPIILSFISGKVGRLEVFSVFSYPRKTGDVQAIMLQGKEKFGGLSYFIYHSESLNFIRGILGRWFNHFSARFLFFEGDWQNLGLSIPNSGMLLYFDFILIPLGLISLIKNSNRFKNFVVAWLIFAPLPSVLSRDQIHPVRSFNMLIPLVIISSFGAYLLFQYILKTKTKGRYFIFTLLSFLLIGSLLYFLDSYFIHLSVHNSRYWQYGYKQMVDTIAPIQDDYEKIKIQQSFAQPYIYFLFFEKYDPSAYQKRANLVESEYKNDVGYVERLDNLYFWNVNWPADRNDSGTILVADSIVIPKEEFEIHRNLKLLKEIKYLNGETAFWVIEIE